MAYDLEKYRGKRERVLGVRSRGLSFGTIAVVVAVVIIGGLGFIAVPKTVSYFSTRNLDDVIYKLEDSRKWDAAIVSELRSMGGVTSAVADNHETRLVVTFNRHHMGPEKFKIFFDTKGVKADLLNRMDHRQRQSILKKEAEFETP
ncbi:MAG: hypothetical protein KKG47_08945 [Proteobacteria bacterium]|nr:hypothetical protein [Pseudomonadota bacterium]MBU1739001.1 hypothetical protein [Pseudomonadota bacterium]